MSAPSNVHPLFAAILEDAKRLPLAIACSKLTLDEPAPELDGEPEDDDDGQD